MQDTNQQPPKRRASDLLAEAASGGSGGPSDSKLILSLLKDVLVRLETLERLQMEHSNAFPKNDLNYPDFDGHRRDHVHRIKAAEVMDKYKESATKSVVSWVAVFLAGLMASGALTWLQSHLTKGTP